MPEIITTKEYTKDGVVMTETIPETVNTKVRELGDLQNEVNALQIAKENAIGFKQVSLDEVAKQDAMIADIEVKIEALNADIAKVLEKKVLAEEAVNIM